MIKSKKPLKKALDEKKCVLELVQWNDELDRPMFAYVLMKKNKLAAFTKALGERDVDLAKFGVIMAYGSGSEPPAGFEGKVLEALRKTT